MNKKDYYNNYSAHNSFERKHVQKLLHQWKIDNNYTCKCVVHHRDDTEECKKYNEEHYELWGFNLDGTFEYGKYVVFMTHADHSSYHNSGHNRCAGANNPMYGRNRKGINAPMYGKKHSAETKIKMSKNHADVSGENNPMYGVHLTVSDETKKKMSEARKGHSVSQETRDKMREITARVKTAYVLYKQNGGNLSWNSFRHEYKNK